MKIFVTGGCGFIGSAVVRYLIHKTNHEVVNIDKMTYAASQKSVACCETSERYFFEKVDIVNKKKIEGLFDQYQPDKIIHLAAESHVDRSIDEPSDFINTNIVGTYVLLDQAHKYYKNLLGGKKDTFRFHHVSTDEVFGDLDDTGFFDEKTSYDPSSPYSASKAASDHLVRAWGRTFGLPYTISNCTNNYGPYQFPEKMIPVMILNCLNEKSLPIYGNGLNVRDWLYVEDHAEAIYKILFDGKNGETYCVGGECEKNNLDIVDSICNLMDSLYPLTNAKDSYKELKTFVKDRDGHDFRYAMDIKKIKSELNWSPIHTFDEGIKKTVKWYTQHWGCVA
ncbi:MAG: dTDP-glucose 4,6-dehydratase [Alphaproteobacteria bacterium CG_4_10_14_0_8_um_filter_37_21]|nr:MAG: dTDP-glucose 4,6-dehydratase [Alphaproteobacteria bacterium CG_4_10_14_0_8_um_filter_37_21]